ncbi:diguanylate cyclase domain-containing protein [Saccharospirillum mangrovi]|uniref:diguanylate cyclase domain-containing protein n=1 Tax=Saccharospirillum mangrovi TaxID=2161747 RepID=UPI000D37A0D7|nr:diguanylate cyclase [Saccharospirillum mangrovi]
MTTEGDQFQQILATAWTQMVSDPLAAQTLIDQARTLVEPNELESIELDFHTGWSFIFQGEYLQALTLFSSALALAERLKAVDPTMRICNGIGMAYYNLGRYGLAERYYERSLELNQQVGNSNGIFAALLNQALLHFQTDDLDTAERLLNQALGSDTREVSLENLGEAALLQANLHSKRSAFDDALLGCRAALKFAQQLNYWHLEIQALIAVARCQRLQGRLVESETTLLVTIDHPEFDREGVSGLAAYLELAKVRASQGRFALAVTALRTGLKRPGLPAFSLLQLRALEVLSVCLEEGGKYQAAMRVMRRALDFERKLQDQDMRRQFEVRQLQAKIDEQRLEHEITDHENRLLKATQARLHLINDLSRELASTLALEEIAPKLYEIVSERLDVHFVSLALNRPRERAVEFVSIIDNGKAVPRYCIPYKVHDSRAVRTACTGEPIVVGDESEKPGISWIGDSQIMPRSQLFMPLIHNHQVLGLFSLQSRFANRFSQEELELLKSLAPFVAITLSNAVSHQRLFELNQALTHEKTQIEAARERIEHMAHHDTLTGLPNRRLLSEFVDVKIRDCAERRCTFYLVYIDLDGFKPVNDRYGHRIGDQVLVLLGKRLSQSLRKADFAARVGGDEFIIIIDEMRPDKQVGDFIKRLLSVIEEPLRIGDETLSLSASIGVAWYDQHGQSLDDLMHHADQAMYDIKRSGKGGVAFASTNRLDA